MGNYNAIPTVCIVGRPNVGKSSLFNALIGNRKSIVVEQPGTTRDRVEAIMHMDGFSLKLVDTGGYSKDKDEISNEVRSQVDRAVEEASLLVMVTDAIAGVMPIDKEVSLVLRKFNKPVILVANKVDNRKIGENALEFYELGLGEVHEISCAHRIGIQDLKKYIFEHLKNTIGLSTIERKKSIKIAIVGRPNVGKSSFVNNLLKIDRVIVSDTPGTTRDSIDTYFNYKGVEYMLIDTAGIRHKRKVKTPVDFFSVMRAEESIKRADIVMLLLDAKDGITKDDMRILDFIEENGKACLVLVNKWDLLDVSGAASSPDEYKKALINVFNRLNIYPIQFISAKTGKNVLSTLSMAEYLNSDLDLKFSTPFLNKILEKKNPAYISISKNKKRPKFYYIVQSSSRPIEFKIFVSDPACVLNVHKNFIENRLRDSLPLFGIPIKLRMIKSTGKDKE